MSLAKVSIITAFYNAENHIADTVQSVLNQSFKHWEHILVDDGSTDNSVQIVNNYIRSDKRIQLIKRGDLPKGPSMCRNIGIQKASGKYLLFLDADDLLHPECLANRMNFVLKQTSCNLSVFKMELFNQIPGDMNKLLNTYYEDNNYIRQFLLGNNPWQTSCSFWEKDFLQKIGGWDIQLQRITDPDIHTRALLHSDIQFVICKNNPADCFYRIYNNIQARSSQWLINSIEGRIYYFKKCYQLITSDEKIEAASKKKYLNYLSKGIITFIKDWLLSRINMIKDDYYSLIKWAYDKHLISINDFLILKCLSYLWINNNQLIEKTRVKGILTNLL